MTDHAAIRIRDRPCPRRGAGLAFAISGREGARTRLEEAVMKKYVLAWLLGVPASVLAVIYLVSNGACR
jgi:hypothetical protein